MLSNEIAAGRLRSFVERIERKDEEIAALVLKKVGVFREAKRHGLKHLVHGIVSERTKTGTTFDEACEVVCATVVRPARTKRAFRPAPGGRNFYLGKGERANLSSEKSFIYFVSAQSGPIKIGVSQNPHRRLRDLQSSSGERLQLLGFVRGNVFEERELQHRLRWWRRHGEWFEPSEQVLSTMASILEDGRIESSAPTNGEDLPC